MVWPDARRRTAWFCLVTMIASWLTAACAPVSASALVSLAALPHRPTPTAMLVVAVIGPTPAPTPSAVLMTETYLPAEGGWGGAAACSGPVTAAAGSGTYVWPTEVHALVGKNFGYGHLGLDLAAAYGSTIRAADTGAVVYSGWNDQGYGMLVILDHGDGWHTLYAHLSQINVACGQGVAQGDVLGLAGSTGNSTGPHLHFEIRSPAGRVNPWDYLPVDDAPAFPP